ncbi:MAG: UDP-2,3-diacylglucosamine diphosphatase [Burkholderiaceae bacterium]
MTDTAVDRLLPWHLPSHWEAVDFISDLHLQASDMATFERWRSFMESPPIKHADALVILGDFFEVWAGDDLLNSELGGESSGFARQCMAILRAHSATRPVYFMHGNRDFLLGPAGLAEAGAIELCDPTLVEWHGARCLLSHGDALCLADTDYLAFRKEVRSDAWQTRFLAQSLQQRLGVTRHLREQSEARKQAAGSDPAQWSDVDAAEARRWLLESGASTLIHGHTHRPQIHDLGDGLQRVVLSDWDATSAPPRAEVLRWDASGFRRLTV